MSVGALEAYPTDIRAVVTRGRKATCDFHPVLVTVLPAGAAAVPAVVVVSVDPVIHAYASYEAQRASQR